MTDFLKLAYELIKKWGMATACCACYWGVGILAYKDCAGQF